jgi:hypothetical protein
MSVVGEFVSFMALRNQLVAGVLVLLALVHMAILFAPSDGKSLDFAAFYRAGLLARENIRALYDRTAQEQVWPLPTNDPHGKSYFYHPPFEVPLLRFFAGFPYKTAFTLWSLATLSLLCAASWLLRGMFQSLPQHPLLLTLAFFPTFALIWIGQDSAWLLLCFVLAYRAFLKEQDWQCGAFVALALFKFQYAIPLIALLAFRRRPKVLIAFSAVAVCLALLSWVMIGTTGIISYCNLLRDHGYEKSARMVNLRGLLSVFGQHPAALTIALSIALLIWFGLHEIPDSIYFPGAVAVAVLVSYHGENYDAVLLLLPLVAVFSIGYRWPAIFFVSPLYLVLLRYNILAIIAVPIAGLVWALSRPLDDSHSLHVPVVRAVEDELRRDRQKSSRS